VIALACMSEMKVCESWVAKKQVCQSMEDDNMEIARLRVEIVDLKERAKKVEDKSNKAKTSLKIEQITFAALQKDHAALKTEHDTKQKQHDEAILALKNEVVVTFENEFNVAPKQVKVFIPTIDISKASPWKIVEDGYSWYGIGTFRLVELFFFFILP